jgi:hypothetical protein
MKALTNWIAENPVVTTWITIISLVGVAITIIALILQIKDKKKRAIYYTINSTVLVANEVSRINGIKILFHDKEIETVVVSKIKLWNGGNDILETNDFYPNCELSIKVPQNEKILAAIVNEETDETCKVNVKNSTQDENVRIIDFYCLEPRQGATITIYHTNIDEKETEVIGKIKGGKVLNRSVEMIIEDGEMCMATGSHKIYFGGLLKPYIQLARSFPQIFGISIVKAKKSNRE